MLENMLLWKTINLISSKKVLIIIKHHALENPSLPLKMWKKTYTKREKKVLNASTLTLHNFYLFFSLFALDYPLYAQNSKVSLMGLNSWAQNALHWNHDSKAPLACINTNLPPNFFPSPETNT